MLVGRDAAGLSEWCIKSHAFSPLSCFSSSASLFASHLFSAVKALTCKRKGLARYGSVAPILNCHCLALPLFEAVFLQASHHVEDHTRFSSFGFCCHCQRSRAKMVYRFDEVSRAEKAPAIRHTDSFKYIPSD